MLKCLLYFPVFLLQQLGAKQSSDSPAYGTLIVHTDDEKQKKLQEERKKEYNELVQKVFD